MRIDTCIYSALGGPYHSTQIKKTCIPQCVRNIFLLCFPVILVYMPPWGSSARRPRLCFVPLGSLGALIFFVVLRLSFDVPRVCLGPFLPGMLLSNNFPPDFPFFFLRKK